MLRLAADYIWTRLPRTTKEERRQILYAVAELLNGSVVDQRTYLPPSLDVDTLSQNAYWGYNRTVTHVIHVSNLGYGWPAVFSYEHEMGHRRSWQRANYFTFAALEAAESAQDILDQLATSISMTDQLQADLWREFFDQNQKLVALSQRFASIEEAYADFIAISRAANGLADPVWFREVGDEVIKAMHELGYAEAFDMLKQAALAAGLEAAAEKADLIIRRTQIIMAVDDAISGEDALKRGIQCVEGILDGCDPLEALLNVCGLTGSTSSLNLHNPRNLEVYSLLNDLHNFEKSNASRPTILLIGWEGGEDIEIAIEPNTATPLRGNIFYDSIRQQVALRRYLVEDAEVNSGGASSRVTLTCPFGRDQQSCGRCDTLHQLWSRLPAELRGSILPPTCDISR